MGLLSWLTGKKPAEAGKADEEPEGGRPAPEAERSGLAAQDLETLGRALESRNGAARIDASRALLERWRHGDSEAATFLVERLAPLLEDAEPTVRQVALAGVRLMRKPENLAKHASAVLALLADKAGPVRSAAIWAAVKLPGEVARTQVKALLTGADEAHRFEAATALAEIGDPAALPILVDVLHEGYRRQEALSSLMTLGDPAALAPLGALWESEEAEGIGQFDRTALAAALARFGDARGAAHLAERAAATGDDRPIAVEWTGRLGVKEAIPALIGLLKDLPIEQAWDVEEFLDLVAGEKSPTVALSAEVGGRVKAVEAWEKWWKENGKTTELTKIDLTRRDLGVYLIVEGVDESFEIRFYVR